MTKRLLEDLTRNGSTIPGSREDAPQIKSSHEDRKLEATDRGSVDREPHRTAGLAADVEAGGKLLLSSVSEPEALLEVRLCLE
jgi:hypothetical protein